MNALNSLSRQLYSLCGCGFRSGWFKLICCFLNILSVVSHVCSLHCGENDLSERAFRAKLHSCYYQTGLVLLGFCLLVRMHRSSVLSLIVPSGLLYHYCTGHCEEEAPSPSSPQVHNGTSVWWVQASSFPDQIILGHLQDRNKSLL